MEAIGLFLQWKLQIHLLAENGMITSAMEAISLFYDGNILVPVRKVYCGTRNCKPIFPTRTERKCLHILNICYGSILELTLFCYI